jgi:hypothetical protein
MLRDRILEAMSALNLYGMKAVLDEVPATGIRQRATPEKILCELLEAEMAERRIRSIRYRMGQAKFPIDKDLEHFDFTSSPVNETLVQEILNKFYSLRWVIFGRRWCVIFQCRLTASIWGLGFATSSVRVAIKSDRLLDLYMQILLTFLFISPAYF